MKSEWDSILNLIIAIINVLVTACVGFQANKISNQVKEHSKKMEQMQMEPAPLIRNIYFKKSLNGFDVNSHMRLFWGNLNINNLSLENQIHVKRLNNNDIIDQIIITECQNYKNRVYFTNIYDKLSFVCNIMESDNCGILEYCSTRIKFRNCRNIIVGVKANFFKIIDKDNKSYEIKGIEKEKSITILEDTEIDIIVCFAITDLGGSLCVSDIDIYRSLPDEEVDALIKAFDNLYLKYKSLILNCTFTTMEREKYTYDIIINVTNKGLEAKIQYIKE